MVRFAGPGLQKPSSQENTVASKRWLRAVEGQRRGVSSDVSLTTARRTPAARNASSSGRTGPQASR